MTFCFLSVVVVYAQRLGYHPLFPECVDAHAVGTWALRFAAAAVQGLMPELVPAPGRGSASGAAAAATESAPLVDQQLEAQCHRPHRAAERERVEGCRHFEHGQPQVVILAGFRPGIVRFAEPLRKP